MKRSKHSLSHYNLLSCNQGELVPIGLVEVLPGDTFQHATSLLMRVSPLLAPVMHPVNAKIHHFYVPHRLVWNKSMEGDANGWESFITGGSDGMDASEFPVIELASCAEGSLANYLGVPVTSNPVEVSALPFRVYAKVFNEFYRDQDLVTELPISYDEGVDATTNLTLQAAAWEKDYFTSARPWEQKGPSISVPLTGNAPLQSTDVPFTLSTEDDGAVNRELQASNAAMTSFALTGANQPSPPQSVKWGDEIGAEAVLSGLTAVDMNDLRLAMALQRYEEARARYGSRYTEYLRFLGIKSSDARLQRPEYLGGGKQTVQFSEVLTTASTGAASFQPNDVVGNLRGHGIAAMRSNRYRRFFEEHGYVISLMVVRPRTIYANGLFRHWNRRTKEDFWQLELQHAGQQAVLKKEVYVDSVAPDSTLGWQDRYDEYRRMESRVAGEFATSTLNFWHMARIFASEPSLNADFITANPTNRIYAVTTKDQLYVMANHSIQARRLVAKTGTSYIF